jgi:hypothetical protein
MSPMNANCATSLDEFRLAASADFASQVSGQPSIQMSPAERILYFFHVFQEPINHYPGSTSSVSFSAVSGTEDPAVGLGL